MRLLRRNTTVFGYRAYEGEQEVLVNGHHTGNYQPSYATAVQYRGNISAPVGFVTDQLFGIDIKYTHVLLMDDPDADIAEDGLIDWKGAIYEIKAVRPSLNVLVVALKKQTENNAPADETEEPDEEGGEDETDGEEQ